MSYSNPTADFVTSTLSGALAAAATSATIGTGLNIPATNGILHLDYDSSVAVGTDEGPETISYATYNSGTGAITGLVRGLAGTTDVAHDNTSKVSAGYSVAHLTADAATDWTSISDTATYASVDGPTQTFTLGADYSAILNAGTKLYYTQEQALQHYWTFNASSAADVGAATMADIGTPTYAAGKFSNALTLNGSNQALSITDAAAFQLANNFTIGCWIKPTNATNANTIFQSYSDNTNAQGIIFGTVVTTGVMTYRVGSGSADDTTTLVGTTNVCDGAQHYVVLSVRNNYAQIYVDGKLEVSGYSTTPTYNATNYVRIGVRNVAGSSVASTWFTGQIDDLFIAAYALDEQTIKAKYDAATAQGTANITLTKYALVSAATTYAAPNSTVTVYSGTDYAVANATITGLKYSKVKAPYGFPLGQDKWSVEVSNSTQGTQGTPTQNTWYNIGTQTISIPIGLWNLYYSVYAYAAHATTPSAEATLSIANNTASESRMTARVFGAANTDNAASLSKQINKSFSAKTSLYLNTRTTHASVSNLYNNNQEVPSIIRATSTLL